MSLITRTGLLESVSKPVKNRVKSPVELSCHVSRAPYILRPFGGLYNPFSFGCSILCNHPADAEIKEVVKRAKDAMVSENKELLAEEMATLEATLLKSEKHIVHVHETTVDFVPEELFRRYTQTDSRPLTPAPTLASAVSRGSLRRRCLTPDQPPVQRKTLVLDLRRSHSQETLYWHGYQTSDISSGLGLSSLGASHQTPASSSPTKLSVTTSDGQIPLVAPATLLRRSPYMRGTVADRGVKLPKNQIKALQNKHLMQIQSKAIQDEPEKSGETSEIEHVEIVEEDTELRDLSSDMRRRGKKKKGRHRVTSAVLMTNAQNDPETQIAGIGSESHNPSSRASIAQSEDVPSLEPSVTAEKKKKPIIYDSFLDQNILRCLQREVADLTIESEFNPKRRFILEEAKRTLQEKTYGKAMNNILNEMKLPPVGLDKWLHTPRVFSRKNATFSLPIDRRDLVGITPMEYVANYVEVSSSKQLLYHTVLEKFNPGSFVMPVKCISEALKVMMGESLTDEMVEKYKDLLNWDSLTQEVIDKLYFKNLIKDDDLNLNNKSKFNGDIQESENLFAEFDVESDQKETQEEDVITINFRLWCCICALCERLFGRLPSIIRDPPHEVEVADFDTIQGKLITQKVNENLSYILISIQQSHGNSYY